MKRRSSSKLKIAVAMAMLMGGAMQSTLALETNAMGFVTELNGYLENGDIDQAMVLLKKLQAMGILRIEVNGRMYAVADLMMILKSGTTAAILPAQVLRSASFVAQNQDSLVSSSGKSVDHFPTSSAG